MPLTFEQFKELRAKGLSDEQINSFEAGGNPTGKSIGGFVGNVAQSGANFVTDIASAVVHPIQTAKAVGSLGVGAVQKIIPGEQAQEQSVDALVGFYKERYGSLDAIKETAYNDPVGFVADLSTFLSGAGVAVKGAATASKSTKLASAANKLTRAGQTVDPILAGGAVAKATVPSTSLATRAERLYQSALKPTKPILDKYPDVVKTGLREGIIVGKDGLDQVGDIISDIDNSVSELIVSSGREGATVSTKDVISRLEEAKQFFAETIGARKYLDELDSVAKEFRAQEGKAIPIERAQKLKQRTGVILRKAYGEMKTVEIEGKKALVRGLKEEISKQIPEVGQLNKRESDLIGLEKALERFVDRSGNRELLSLGQIGAAGTGALVADTARGKVASAVSGLALKMLDNPEIKSRIANILFKISQKESRAKPGLIKRSLTPASVINKTRENNQDL